MMVFQFKMALVIIDHLLQLSKLTAKLSGRANGNYFFTTSTPSLRLSEILRTDTEDSSDTEGFIEGNNRTLDRI